VSRGRSSVKEKRLCYSVAHQRSFAKFSTISSSFFFLFICNLIKQFDKLIGDRFVGLYGLAYEVVNELVP